MAERSEEKEGKVKSYKAVFDYKKINEGHTTYIMVNLIPEKYGDPEKIAAEMAKDKRVESIDICTGDYELLLKLRTKDIDEYYEYRQSVNRLTGSRRRRRSQCT